MPEEKGKREKEQEQKEFYEAYDWYRDSVKDGYIFIMTTEEIDFCLFCYFAHIFVNIYFLIEKRTLNPSGNSMSFHLLLKTAFCQLRSATCPLISSGT